MSRVNDFLTEAGVFFLATTDGNQPKLRPLGAHMEIDGKIIFGVGDFKNVYKQMIANPLVEIAACKADGHWLRYTGKAVFETDYSYAEQMIKESGLEAIYNEQTGGRDSGRHRGYGRRRKSALRMIAEVLNFGK